MKIALIGYGKMGKMIEEIAVSRGHEIVSIIDIDNLGDFESAAFASADVAIEFTTPGTAYDNVLKCFAAGVKCVCGSTGWFEGKKAEMEALCSEGKTLFWASNYSVGVAIFSAVNKFLARIMNGFEQYSVKMNEVHHVHKLDHPSGTAKTLASQIVANLNRVSEVEIESERRGEVPGIHSVIYDSDADCITITHDAHTRRGFALGAVLAAEFTAEHEGLLGIDDLFAFGEIKN